MGNFSETKVQEVWEKASIEEGFDSKEWRKDACGAWIDRKGYGQEGKYGWEIDHVYPESKGGNHDIENLSPMHWENNRSKADSYPKYKAVVTSSGVENVPKEREFTVDEELQKILAKKFHL